MNRNFLMLLFWMGMTAGAYCQESMFRGTADHNASYTSAKKIIFAEEAWSCNANGPIRSTAVASQGMVYFGCSNGNFYALDQRTGKVKWKYNTGFAIHSSPAVNKNRIYFSDNKQSLYALDANKGKLLWKYEFGESRSYDWAFDYYYSSPTLFNGFILIGAKDGFVYKMNEATGKPQWKFQTEGIVRGTPAVESNAVYFGDTNGILYAVDFNSGKELWRFLSVGNGLKNEDFGFDRRALISSPTVKEAKVFVGGRDGFFYAVDRKAGKELWRVNHEVSWVISSLAIKDTIVVTGTSDGHLCRR